MKSTPFNTSIINPAYLPMFYFILLHFKYYLKPLELSLDSNRLNSFKLIIESIKNKGRFPLVLASLQNFIMLGMCWSHESVLPCESCLLILLEFDVPIDQEVLRDWEKQQISHNCINISWVSWSFMEAVQGDIVAR